MAYFPFFVELAGARGLIVGGGRTALGKVRRLAEYGPNLTVVAPEILPALEAAAKVTPVRRGFVPEDLNGDLTFVIAATDDGELNRTVARLCRERRIPVNVVDAPEDCSFLFPALVRRGPLSIGVSTGGASPTAAVRIKREIGAMLPEGIGAILAWLAESRDAVKGRFSSETARKRAFQALYEEALRRGRPLTGDETEELLRREEA